jgi:hypothetical protein
MTKTIEINGTKFELTQERRNRITSALIETAEKLDKELGYSEDLQHKDMITFYQNHIAKLQSYLA